MIDMGGQRQVLGETFVAMFALKRLIQRSFLTGSESQESDGLQLHGREQRKKKEDTFSNAVHHREILFLAWKNF